MGGSFQESRTNTWFTKSKYRHRRYFKKKKKKAGDKSEKKYTAAWGWFISMVSPDTCCLLTPQAAPGEAFAARIQCIEAASQASTPKRRQRTDAEQAITTTWQRRYCEVRAGGREKYVTSSDRNDNDTASGLEPRVGDTYVVLCGRKHVVPSNVTNPHRQRCDKIRQDKTR